MMLRPEAPRVPATRVENGGISRAAPARERIFVTLSERLAAGYSTDARELHQGPALPGELEEGQAEGGSL